MKLKKSKGFTLIELMIVVAIIGILAAVAFPAYQDSVRKGKRSDGQAALMDIMAKQERYYTDNNTYTADLTDLGFEANTDGDILSTEQWYALTAAACGSGIGSCVKLTGTAQGDQANDGNLTLDSGNNKTGNW